MVWLSPLPPELASMDQENFEIYAVRCTRRALTVSPPSCHEHPREPATSTAESFAPACAFSMLQGPAFAL